MAIDVKTLSAQELKALATQIKKQQGALSKRKPVAGVRKKIVSMAKAEGYTLVELFGVNAGGKPAAKKTTARKLGKVAPKYRNPANAKETWSGRGKQPLWLAGQVKKGKKVEDFLIKK